VLAITILEPLEMLMPVADDVLLMFMACAVVEPVWSVVSKNEP
jgi:hypothetical protein